MDISTATHVVPHQASSSCAQMALAFDEPHIPITTLEYKPYRSRSAEKETKQVEQPKQVQHRFWELVEREVLKADDEPVTPFTEDEVEEMHNLLYHQSMKTLTFFRTADEVRREILVWVQSNENTPFSFNICVRLQGANPEVMREMLLCQFAKDFPYIEIPSMERVKAFSDDPKAWAKPKARQKAIPRNLLKPAPAASSESRAAL